MTDPEIQKVFDRWAASEMQTRGTHVHREPMSTANSGPDGRPGPARLVSIPKIDEFLPPRGIGFHCGLLFRIDSRIARGKRTAISP
jgi:hypothetical protein